MACSVMTPSTTRSPPASFRATSASRAPASTPAPGDEQPDADGGVACRHGQNRGGGEGCGYAASLGQRKRVAHIPTAEAEAARSGLILEGQGQARLHLKFNDPWSYEWGPAHSIITTPNQSRSF